MKNYKNLIFTLFFLSACVVAKAQQNVFLESENEGMGADGPGAPPNFNSESPTVMISQYSEYLIIIAIVFIVFLAAKFVKKTKQQKKEKLDQQQEYQ